MKKYILILLSIIGCIPAQAQYVSQGIIEYEKKVNLHKQLEDFDNKEMVERFKSQMPKFVTSFFNLYFTLDESLYKKGKEVENPVKLFGGNAPASDNIVHSNFKTSRVLANKDIFEQKYLVDDSLRKIDWKIYDEVRVIANYTCRKAVGRICDSVYVVAFYTDDIRVSGGPEMFSGLPGMILEIAIPRLYSTWVATKVTTQSPAADNLKAPEKGKKTTQKELEVALANSFKSFQQFAHRNIWWCML